MSHTSHSGRAPANAFLPSGLAAQALLGAAIVLATVLWLDWAGRPYTCPCGTVALWDGDPFSPGASQQFADWYSALHVIFGIGLYAFIRRMAPQWPTSWMFLTALASSAVWEIVENTPFVIALFGDTPGTPSYSGDSILNALGDTVFVAAGFFAARALPVAATLALALGLEVAIAIAIHDGFLFGTLRLLGAELPMGG